MKTHSQKLNAKILVGAAIGLALLFIIYPHSAVAQSNTFPGSGNVGIGTTAPGEKLVTVGNILGGNISSHTQLYSGYDSQANVIMELGYGTATSEITPLPSLVLSKNLTSPNNPVGVISFANSSIANGNEKRLSAIGSWTDGATNSGSLSFYTSSVGTLAERLRITSGGNVGIGTTSPSLQSGVTNKMVEIQGSVNPGLALTATSTGGRQFVLYSSQTNPGYFSIFDAGATADRFVINSSGSVGIGTATPGYKFDVQGGQINGSGGLCIAGDCRTAWPLGGGSSQWTTSNSNVYYNSGNVGIGTPNPSTKLHVVGDINATGTGNINASGTITGGNIVAKYQDVAEWVESSQTLPAGTVVVLDHSKSNQVIASSHAYDTRVAGVISEQPGIALGEKGESKVLVATTGRVKVKVDASSGPIQVGDLLVTSDTNGMAMKSQPVNLGGIELHRPGTLIGKALEPLATGTGEIMVLLSLQ